MRKITENQGNPRTNGCHFSPGNKVKDLQQQPLPHFTSLHQETPMKPSQVPNLLSHPPPRRALPLQISDLPFKDRSDSPQHRTHVPGSFNSPGPVPGSPINISSSVNRPYPIPKDRLGPMQHLSQSSGHASSSTANMGSSVYRPHPTPRDRPGPIQQSGQPRPGTFDPSQFFPVRPTNSNTSPNKLQPSSYSVYLNHHAPSFPINTDQKALSRLTPGSKNVTAHRQVSNKAEPSDGSSYIPTVQLHRLPMNLMNPPLNTKSSQEFHPQRPSGSERWDPAITQRLSQGLQSPPNTQSCNSSGGSSSTHSYKIPQQSQEHEQTPPRVKPIPVVDLNSSSQKRPRESEHFDENAKKLCSRGTFKTQKTDPDAGDSAAISLFPQSSSNNSTDMELSPTVTGHLCGKLACGQSTCVEPPTPTQLCHTSLLHKDSSEGQPSMGVKQAYINLSESVVKLKVVKSNEENKKRRSEEHSKGDKSSTLLTSEVPQKDRRSLPHRGIGNHNSSHAAGSMSVSTVQTQSHGNHTEVSRKLDCSTSKWASKPNPGSLGCRPVDRSKTPRARRPIVIPDDTDVLFTPDPITYVVSPGNNKTKLKINGEPARVASSDKGLLGSPTDSSVTSTGSSCHKAKNSSSSGLCQTASSSAHHPQNISPSVTVIPDDTDVLFTPDPITYVVSPGNNKTKPKINGEPASLASSDKSSLSSPTDSSVTSTGSSCHKAKNSSLGGSCQTVSSSAHHPQSISPNVTLKQVQHETHCPKDDELIDKVVKPDDKPLISTNGTAVSGKSSLPSCPPSLPLERPVNEKSTKQANEEDSIDEDLDLDLGLSIGIDVDLTHSSNGSEEDELISLREMMECVLKPPETPEKGAFSEPSTPGHRGSQPKTQLLPSTSKSGIYKNNLDQMLKDINTDKKSEDTVAQLLTACKEDLLRIAEYEDAQQNREEGISTEQQEFLQRYSLMSSAIREVPPGEAVFNLDKFGQIFDQKTLELRKCMVNPQGTAQKTLLWSSPAQLKLHVYIGLFQEAYNSLPCPTQVTRFLFKMMSVHNERILSEKILQALCDIACSAAYQIVENGSKQFKVWVPSLADVSLVLMNMGVPFVTLFPFEDLQPPFTEGDLLDDVYIKSESLSSSTEPVPFPEHNCSNILKYLSYCMCLCPHAYSDEELLLLLTVISRLSLDMRLTLLSSKDLYPIHCKIVNNFRDWGSMLPRICQTLTNLTDDHHNMCLLVHLQPINSRGKQLRRHLSLSMISRLLDGSCTYRPKEKEFQLSELRPYISRIQPSFILREMVSSSSKTEKEKEEDTPTPDQQSYYMCYSLLTLLNEATNFQFFPANQKEQLLFLSNELEAHVKCDIRESEKCLYRTKVKDLVARIYTKWRMLLQRTKPLNHQLYDYWQPMDAPTDSQETASGTLL